MFWRSTSTFGQPSVVDSLLERSDVTLEHLLDEDDLQQVPGPDRGGSLLGGRAAADSFFA